MTHRFKVGELAILINPIYQMQNHNVLCVIMEPYRHRISRDTTAQPPVELPPEWLYQVKVFGDDSQDYLVDQSQLKPLVKPASDKRKHRQWKRRHQRKPELVEV